MRPFTLPPHLRSPMRVAGVDQPSVEAPQKLPGWLIGGGIGLLLVGGLSIYGLTQVDKLDERFPGSERRPR